MLKFTYKGGTLKKRSIEWPLLQWKHKIRADLRNMVIGNGYDLLVMLDRIKWNEIVKSAKTYPTGWYGNIHSYA